MDRLTHGRWRKSDRRGDAYPCARRDNEDHVLTFSGPGAVAAARGAGAAVPLGLPVWHRLVEEPISALCVTCGSKRAPGHPLEDACEHHALTARHTILGESVPAEAPYGKRMNLARANFISYFEERRAFNRRLSRPRITEPLPIRLKKRLLPQALRFPIRLALTAMLAPRERRRAKRISGEPSLRLHLGSHLVRKKGWVNIDLAGIPVDLAWNLAKPLPFPDQSVEAVFHEHLLEHLTLEQGLRMTDECYRVLQPGGVLRVVVPDAADLVRAYAEGKPAPHGGQCPTAFLALQEPFYRYGHRTMYDAETLGLLLEAAGFTGVERCAYGKSRLQPAPDSEGRSAESLYVEGVRPR